jgi:hypothetical protein
MKTYLDENKKITSFFFSLRSADMWAALSDSFFFIFLSRVMFSGLLSMRLLCFDVVYGGV